MGYKGVKLVEYPFFNAVTNVWDTRKKMVPVPFGHNAGPGRKTLHTYHKPSHAGKPDSYWRKRNAKKATKYSDDVLSKEVTGVA